MNRERRARTGSENGRAANSAIMAKTATQGWQPGWNPYAMAHGAVWRHE
jgi:hypothetical protein